MFLFKRLRRELIDNDGNSYYEEYIEFLEQRVQEQRRRLKEKEEEEKQARLKALEEVRTHKETHVWRSVYNETSRPLDFSRRKIEKKNVTL